MKSDPRGPLSLSSEDLYEALEVSLKIGDTFNWTIYHHEFRKQLRKMNRMPVNHYGEILKEVLSHVDAGVANKKLSSPNLEIMKSKQRAIFDIEKYGLNEKNVIASIENEVIDTNIITQWILQGTVSPLNLPNIGYKVKRHLSDYSVWYTLSRYNIAIGEQRIESASYESVLRDLSKFFPIKGFLQHRIIADDFMGILSEMRRRCQAEELPDSEVRKRIENIYNKTQFSREEIQKLVDSQMKIVRGGLNDQPGVLVPIHKFYLHRKHV